MAWKSESSYNPAVAPSNQVIAFLAFVERVVRVRRNDGRLGIEDRSEHYLKRLSQPEESLPFRIALQNLSRESDLLDEELALEPTSLLLQRRVLELAATQTTAKVMAARMLTEPPIAKLFAAILAEAEEGGWANVRVEVGAKASIPVKYSRGGKAWEEAMTMPANLAKPFLGFAALIEAIGYQVAQSHLWKKGPLPGSINFQQVDPDAVQLVLR